MITNEEAMSIVENLECELMINGNTSSTMICLDRLKEFIRGSAGKDEEFDDQAKKLKRANNSIKLQKMLLSEATIGGAQ